MDGDDEHIVVEIVHDVAVCVVESHAPVHGGHAAVVVFRLLPDDEQASVAAQHQVADLNLLQAGVITAHFFAGNPFDQVFVEGVELEPRLVGVFRYEQREIAFCALHVFFCVIPSTTK
ncbi:MAG: hypothetical protein ACK559_34065, partial [bacterium]